MVYAVRFGAGTARRYLAHAEGHGLSENGFRPFVWTKSVERAGKFGSAADARTYALEHLGHSQFDVALVPGRGLPTNDLGGSPVAMRAAA